LVRIADRVRQYHCSLVWPHIEVIDLTNNKLNDIHEILHLFDGQIVRKELIKFVGIKGNQFYNSNNISQKSDYRSMNFDMDEVDIIDSYSSYRLIDELNRVCFMTTPFDNPDTSRVNRSEMGRDLLLSFQKSTVNPANALSMILNQKIPSSYNNYTTC
jgi:hypothetical protein